MSPCSIAQKHARKMTYKRNAGNVGHERCRCPTWMFRVPHSYFLMALQDQRGMLFLFENYNVRVADMDSAMWNG